jgi:hypothetical protein
MKGEFSKVLLTVPCSIWPFTTPVHGLFKKRYHEPEWYSTRSIESIELVNKSMPVEEISILVHVRLVKTRTFSLQSSSSGTNQSWRWCRLAMEYIN